MPTIPPPGETEGGWKTPKAYVVAAVALAGCSVAVLGRVMPWLYPVSGRGGWGKGSGKGRTLLLRVAERLPDRLGLWSR